MFAPVDFFYLARELHYSPIKPLDASYRSCVNRAYYAAFLAAREKAKIKNDDRSVHQKVIEYYTNKKETTLANRLKTLRALRQDADYELSNNITDRETASALRYANLILASLNIIVSEYSAEKPIPN